MVATTSQVRNYCCPASENEEVSTRVNKLAGEFKKFIHCEHTARLEFLNTRHCRIHRWVLDRWLPCSYPRGSSWALVIQQMKKNLLRKNFRLNNSFELVKTVEICKEEWVSCHSMGRNSCARMFLYSSGSGTMKGVLIMVFLHAFYHITSVGSDWSFECCMVWFWDVTM